MKAKVFSKAAVVLAVTITSVYGTLSCVSEPEPPAITIVNPEQVIITPQSPDMITLTFGPDGMSIAAPADQIVGILQGLVDILGIFGLMKALPPADLPPQARFLRPDGSLPPGVEPFGIAIDPPDGIFEDYRDYCRLLEEEDAFAPSRGWKKILGSLLKRAGVNTTNQSYFASFLESAFASALSTRTACRSVL